MSTPELTEGWGVIPPGSRKAHYYRDSMSLCRTRGFYFGPLSPDEFASPDDCKACRKELTAEKNGLRRRKGRQS